MFDKFLLNLERWHYARYMALNIARKAKEPSNKVFQALDMLRRNCGYVRFR